MTINTDVLRGTGVSLEQEAYKQFGLAVENQVDGALGKILGQKTSMGASDSSAAFAPGIKDFAIWNPTKYAAATVDRFYPKNKFLFRVKLVFNPAVTAKMASMGYDAEHFNELTYAVKSIDLPTISFDYEDVNLYNHKTKVLKGITHQDLQLALYDDTANVALNTVMYYLQLLSPITRNPYRAATPSSFFEDGSMNFTNLYNAAKDKTGSRDILPNNAIDPLAYILVEQYFAPSASPNQAMLKANTFTFTNPKITRFDISDQNYEDGSSGNIVTVAFNCDAINMSTNENISDINASSVGQGFAGGDILGAAQDRSYAGAFGAPNRMAAGKSRNPFVDIISTQGKRAVDNAVRNVLNKQLGGFAGGALGNVISKVGGAVGDAASRTLKGASENVVQNIALPSFSKIKDSASNNESSN